jgi:ribosomal subunit interface protein
METTINAIHFDISQNLTDFINRKIERLSRRNPNASSAEVNLKVVKPETAMNKEARISVRVPQESDIVATKVADTFEEAVDLALEAIERQLERSKAKK